MKGLLVKSTGSWYTVRMDDGSYKDCRLKGKFRIKGMTTTNPLAVGDHVIIEEGTDGVGVITDIEPRKNYIIRKSVNLSRQGHIIAANLDQCVLVFTLRQPETPLGFVDRFLVTAEAYGIPVTIVFHKSDLLNEDDRELVEALKMEYEDIGYSCLIHSSLKDSPEPIQKLLKGKVTLISGQSGAGKSSLINAVQPGLGLKVGEISEYHEKGQHTTTFAEMFELDMEGFIIDTPGIKGFGLVDMDKEVLSHYFPEMRALMDQCRFHNCRHINEPGCAVKAAVEEGKIWDNRYYNYLSIYNDDEEESYRGKGY